MADNDDILVSKVKVIGRYPSVERVKTGLLSMDVALGHHNVIGLPLRSGIELYGLPNVGKSTLAYFIAGIVANATGTDITVADLEMANIEYISMATALAGFQGTVVMEELSDADNKPLPHERILYKWATKLMLDTYGAGIWDSVGATIPLSEMETFTKVGKKDDNMFGQRFMGQKPILVQQVASAARTALMTKTVPSTYIAVNHQQPNIGFAGHYTPGGQRIKHLVGMRIAVKKGESFLLSEEDKGSNLGYLVKGQLEKKREGGPGATFQYYIVPGLGVHPGVTALFDAIDYGMAEYTKTGHVKVNGRSVGRLRSDLLEYALEGHLRKFYVFQEIVEKLAEGIEHGDVQPPAPDTDNGGETGEADE